MIIRFPQLSGAFAPILIATVCQATAFSLETYTAGHADIAVYNSGTDLLLRYNFASTATVNGSPVGGTGRIADPALIETIVPESSTIEVPDVGAYSEYWRGRTSWYLPPGNLPGVPDLGLGKQVSSGIFTGNEVTLYLDSIVSRPTGGEFMMISSAGSPVYMDTANPSSLNRIVIPGHDHYYWMFSEVGTYQFNFRAEAIVQATGLTSSTLSTFTFTVVPEPSTWALAAVGTSAIGIVAYRGRRERIPPTA